MTKTVTIPNGRMFGTVTLAKAHYHAIRDSGEVDQAYTGDDAADLGSLYRAYCDVTEWTMPGQPTAFFPTWERRPGFSTRCVGVTFDDGTSLKWSIDKALKAIAV